MALNRLSGRALYRQVADELRARIEGPDAYLTPGDELPAEGDLQDEFEVGSQTIKKALLILVHEEVIVSERGQLHKVADRPEPTEVLVGPDAVVTGRIARPQDAEKHRVLEGSYVLVVVEGNRERLYPARSTVIRFRKR